MSLFEELIEDKKNNEKIIKSFKGRKILCPSIFELIEEEYLMIPLVRDRLLEISNYFIDSLGIEVFIHDIVLTGSLANYNWSKYSDVDVHVVVDFNELVKTKSIPDGFKNILEEFFNSKKTLWNEKHKIKIKGFDIELYVQNIDEKHISSGVYSILYNKWIIFPSKINSNIDDRKIIEKGEEFAKKIDFIIDNQKDIDTHSKLDNLLKKIKQFRQAGLNKGGELSYENLTFKLLRRNGYIKKIIKLKTQILDKNLSIKETDTSSIK